MSPWWLPTVALPLGGIAMVGTEATLRVNQYSMKGLFTQSIPKTTAIRRVGWTQLVASAWIHGTGAWVLFAPAETGYRTGVFGVLAYAVGCAVPGLAFAVVGPYMASLTRGHSLVDWIRERYGHGLYTLMVFISLFFLFIVASAEMTGLLNAYDYLIRSEHIHTGDPAWVNVCIVAVALIYSTLGGLQVSFITDRVEALFCIAFLVLCGGVVYSLGTDIRFDIEWEPTEEAGNAAVVLIIGCLVNEMINQGQWQRVFSARDHHHLRRGAVIGAGLCFIQIFIFGLCGVFVKALFTSGDISDQPEYWASSTHGTDAFFWAINRQSPAYTYVTLAMTCCVVCSTMDSLMNACSSVIMKELRRKEMSLNWTPFINLLFTSPSVVIAAHRWPVISLFMTVNIIAVSVVPGLFWGVFPRRSSALSVKLTFALAIVNVLWTGYQSNGTLAGSFGQFLFPRGPYCRSSASLFISCLLISSLGTPLISYIEYKIRPDYVESEWRDYLRAKNPFKNSDGTAEGNSAKDEYYSI